MGPERDKQRRKKDNKEGKKKKLMENKRVENHGGLLLLAFSEGNVKRTARGKGKRLQRKKEKGGEDKESDPSASSNTIEEG